MPLAASKLLASVVAHIGQLVLLIGTSRQFTVKDDGKRRDAPDPRFYRSFHKGWTDWPGLNALRMIAMNVARHTW
jgi:hypothetical protein